MCILFVKLIKSAKKNEFKFVLASNRDESFKRPARSANFWEQDANIIGGRDMTTGREGGTWLAMSRNGKVGVLLNVSGEEPDPQKLGRGFLVVNFLKSQSPDREFLMGLSQTGYLYNKFHLVTASFGPQPGLHHYTNGTLTGVTELTDNVLAISNSSIDQPYQKAKEGKKRFEEIIRKKGSVDKKEELVNELLMLLKWDKMHYPDDVLDSFPNVPVEMRRSCSSIFVAAPKSQYGTRTHTIILVDTNNDADFYEWTLKEPIDCNNMEWIKTHERFKLIE